MKPVTICQIQYARVSLMCLENSLYEPFTYDFLNKDFRAYPMLFKLFKNINLSERKRAQAEGGAEAEGEAGSPLSREPDEGLDPRALEP